MLVACWQSLPHGGILQRHRREKEVGSFLNETSKFTKIEEALFFN